MTPLPHGGSVPGENSFNRAPGGKCAQETCAGYPQQRLATGEPGKVLGRDRVGIVEGIVVPFATRGVGIRGKLFLLSPRGKMGTGDLCRVPTAPVSHGRTRQSSWTGPCGSCGYRVRGISIRFIEKHGYKTLKLALWLYVVLIPG